jgi:hypothetical protein
MVEKQWTECHADWKPGFRLKKGILQADFLTSSSSPTILMQDLEPMDPLTSHPNPKSFCGCAK